MTLNSVFLQRFTEGSEIEPMLREACEGLALAGDIRLGTRVSIKPNYTYPWYKPGVTTSPAVLEATVRVLRDYTQHIQIVESDGGSSAWTAEQAFEGHGVPAICRKYGVTAVGLTNQLRKLARTVVDGREIEMELPTTLLDETDFFITMPVPKVHAMTGVSLGFKNQWGCIPDVKRLRHHPDFQHKIIAVNKLLRTRLAVFDGTYFLNRSGPMNGDPVRKNMLIVGEVGVATAVCCDLMQVKPGDIAHLRIAIKEGLMPGNLNDILCNADLGRLRSPFRLERSPIDWISLAIFHSNAATRLCYDSELAAPLHSALYMIKGKPKDFAPVWGTSKADLATPGKEMSPK
ncbi:MAG: DUF362 domain-containing protein [Bryobacteraceae bacterium]